MSEKMGPRERKLLCEGCAHEHCGEVCERIREAQLADALEEALHELKNAVSALWAAGLPQRDFVKIEERLRVVLTEVS